VKGKSLENEWKIKAISLEEEKKNKKSPVISTVSEFHKV
jgi:hypothetical protein